MLNRPARLIRSAKSRMRDSLREFLVERGIVLFRVPPGFGMPPRLDQYLKGLSDRGMPADAVFSFDDEPYIQKDLLGAFSAEQVRFVSFAPPQSDTPGFPTTSSLKRPAKPFLVELDGETFDLPWLVKEIPWIVEAEVVLVRSTLGYFWSGGGDLRQLVQFLAERGFVFFDALDYFKLHLLNAAMGRIVLAFEKRKSKPTRLEAGQPQNSENDGPRLGRINEAMAFLSNPVARSSQLVRLTGRGSFGFAAGVLNPGAVASKEGIILLARGEQIPWAISRQNLAGFKHGCQPVLFELDDKLSVIRTDKAVFSNAKAADGARLEDFRLFRHDNQLFSNHVQAMSSGGNPSEQRPIRPEDMQFRVGISRVNADENELTFLGTPALDIPLNFAEKNWAVFEHQNELYLIYSFNPFHLLRANRWPQLDFVTVIRQKLAPPYGDDHVPFRNSVNPVEYDGNFLLHVVHKVYPGKQYVFWAVLIEKNSLLPKMISGRPLVGGWKSAPASIIYACAIIVRKEDVIVFGGINDSSMGFWKISRSELDMNWIALENN